MSTTTLAKKLSVAAAALVAASGQAAAQSNVTRLSSDWVVDTSYLSYVESDNRVAVSKSIANLSKRMNQSEVSVNLVNDTMSGASPTGAIQDGDADMTVSGASGDSSESGRAYTISTFDDQRVQASVNYDHEHSGAFAMGYGVAVSSESDYESFGGNVTAARSTPDKLSTYQLGLSYTSDTIYRSDTGTTPEPLANIQQRLIFSQGGRVTTELMTGYSRVINRRTVAQVNLTLAQSRGYHSDPYKIISAADDSDMVVANFHDSRPQSRLRASLFTKLVHQLKDTENSLHASYRLYNDDWGISSHTLDFSYRHTLSKKQFIEPSVRFYAQSEADFYRRKLTVDSAGNPELPDDGIASADYRLDRMTSATFGVKYGVSLTPRAQMRIRAEYLDQRFSTSDFNRLGAVIMQASFSYSF